MAASLVVGEFGENLRLSKPSMDGLGVAAMHSEAETLAERVARLDKKKKAWEEEKCTAVVAYKRPSAWSVITSEEKVALAAGACHVPDTDDPESWEMWASR